MNRPRQTWILFGLSLVVVLIALGRVTFAALKLDDAQRRAEERAGVEERVRLALWRMDSALALLLAEEDARSVSAYDAFYPSQRAFSRGKTGYDDGEVLLSSPLLGFASTNVWLHFQFGPDGKLSSPQVPTGDFRSLAESSDVPQTLLDAASLRLARLQVMLDGNAPESAQSEFGGALSGSIFSSVGRNPRKADRTYANRDAVLEDATEALANVMPSLFRALPVTPPGGRVPTRAESTAQSAIADNELQARFNLLNNPLGNQRGAARQEIVASPGSPRPNTTPELVGKNSAVQVGRLTASWVSAELLLTRRVNFTNDYRVQGCWLNWPAIRQGLLSTITNLLPEADLQVVYDSKALDPTPRLVALRGVALELRPGPIDSPVLAMWSPVRVTLALAWVAVVCAALAVGLLLNGAVSLSERRAAFVSAVTHELRTPLTTFKMYSEMLAEDMVTDPVQRHRYLETLCSEANRLAHLVENVLAYARIERGSARSRVERVLLGTLMERVMPRLQQRVEQAGTRLLVSLPPAAAETVVQVDGSAVEQILFNLIDNACKYGTGVRVGAAPIEMEFRTGSGRCTVIRVRDHGPGIPAEVASKLFEPFCKSADEAARTSPGVGLGLALCRRLVRSMGGDLIWDSATRDGTCFELHLPLPGRGGEPALA